MRNLLMQFIPPIFLSVFRSLVRGNYGLQGDYKRWEEAEALCQGYADDGLFERVKTAALRVKSGEFFSERDSFLFKEPQYSWASLSCLLSVAAREGGRLSVLDFGGSLGSSYFLNRRFLAGIDAQWSVVEQAHFVEFGAAHIAEGQLGFFPDIAICRQGLQPNVLLLSSVLQYLPAPQHWLDTLCAEGLPYIVIDRTPFNQLGRDVLKVQRVDPRIYTASYPAWTLDEGSFLAQVDRHGYRVIETFDSPLDTHGEDFIFKGFFLEKVSHAIS